MKHKVMADALTMIDDALIEDSDIKGIDRQTRILRYAKRFGGLAACLVIIGGLFILAGNQDRILLDGQKLTGDPTSLCSSVLSLMERLSGPAILLTLSNLH